MIVTVGFRHQPTFCVPESVAFDTGAVVSTIVTLKEPLEEFPAPSVAVQFTVVSPTGKPEPEAGKQFTTGFGSASSVAVAE